MTTLAVTAPGPAAGLLPPLGMRIRLSETVTRCGDGQILFDTSSGTQIRLLPRAVQLLADGSELTVSDVSGARLARALLDRGLADPQWGTAPDSPPMDVTLVVPVRDRPGPLADLLAALPDGLPVIVVDDGSIDARATAAVVAAARANLLRHERSRGPAAARNTGMRAATTDFVLFLDSDVQPDPRTIGVLRLQFLDPAVAIAGPRVLGRELPPGAGAVARYEAARSSLDLGDRPARVAPATRVSYLPSAALMCRVAAIGDGFDETMQVAEDVDLIWRTVDAGWTVRYVPDCTVRHDHRTATGQWLRRKAFYGTGAEPLARRHGDLVAPMRLDPLAAVAVGSLVLPRRWSLPLAGAAAAAHLALMAARTRPPQSRWSTAAALTSMTLVSTAWQGAASVTRHHWPLAAGAALYSARARRVVALAALAEGAADYRKVRPDLDPVRYIAAHRADDVAYGAGVWLGAIRGRSLRPLLPAWTRPWRRPTPTNNLHLAQGDT